MDFGMSFMLRFFFFFFFLGVGGVGGGVVREGRSAPTLSKSATVTGYLRCMVNSFSYICHSKSKTLTLRDVHDSNIFMEFWY